MPIELIPINTGANKAEDEIGLLTLGAALVDGYVDILGSVNRRPGLTLFADLGTAKGVDGLYWWDAQECVVAVSNGSVFKITASDGTYSDVTGDSMEIGTRVKEADFGTTLYMANGAQIVKLASVGNTAYVGDIDAPTNVTHVGVLDKYLIANESDSERFHYAIVNDPDSWAGDFASAEVKPDYLVALGISNMELNLLGKRTHEVWRDDGSTPFVRELQGFVQSGTVAPYSFTWCGHAWYWLDTDREVVRLVDRTTVPIHDALNKYIQSFSTVSDAIGDYVTAAGKRYYVLHFPTEGKTIAISLTKPYLWAEWGYWNTGTAEYERWKGNCHCLATAWNLSLIGDRSTGKVYKFLNTAYDDNSDILRTMVRTANINRGTESRRKKCKKIVFRLKRSEIAIDASVPNLLVKWRDNGASTWNTERTVALGQVGKTEFKGELRSLGTYYSRQYEFVVSDSVPLVLVTVEEDFDYTRY